MADILDITYIDIIGQQPTLINVDNSFDVEPLHSYEEEGTPALIVDPHRIEKRKDYVNYVLHSCSKWLPKLCTY